MQFCQEHCNYSDNVSTLGSRTIMFAPSARRRAPSPALQSTTLYLILSIASTISLALYKQPEATPRNAPTYTPILVLAHLPLLFSMLGSLSSKLIPCPVIRAMFHNHPTSFEGPGRPVSTVVIRSQMDVGMLDMPHQPPVPPWLIQEECMGLFFNVHLRKLVVLHSPDLGIHLHLWTVFCSGCQWLYGPAACSVAWRRLRTSSRFIPWTS